MTGFARVRKNLAEGEVVISIKSVNHRGLDLHFHVPPDLEALETGLRGIVKDQVARGHLQIHLIFTRAPAAGASLLNRPLLDAYVRAFREAAAALQTECEPDVNAVLAVQGILSAGGRDELEECVAEAAREAAREAM